MKRAWSQFNKPKLADAELAEGAEKRAKIISLGQAMKRLEANTDFDLFLSALRQDREGLNSGLLKGDNDDRENVRLIARINQIDQVLKKTKHLIWQMENLTEVRAAIKEQQSLVRQAHGNKTGG